MLLIYFIVADLACRVVLMLQGEKHSSSQWGSGPSLAQCCSLFRAGQQYNNAGCCWLHPIKIQTWCCLVNPSFLSNITKSALEVWSLRLVYHYYPDHWVVLFDWIKINLTNVSYNFLVKIGVLCLTPKGRHSIHHLRFVLWRERALVVLLLIEWLDHKERKYTTDSTLAPRSSLITPEIF